MMKLGKIAAYAVVFLTLLCAWSFAVYYVATGGQGLGKLTKPVLNFARLPMEVKTVLESPEVADDKPFIFREIPKNFHPINKLDYDLFGTMSFYNKNDNVWEIRLLNFRNDKTEYEWKYTEKYFNKSNRQFKNSIPKNSLVLPDKSIVGRMSYTPNLFRLDSLSNIVWQNEDLKYHHSLMMDDEGNLWACASNIINNQKTEFTGGLVHNFNDKMLTYREDYVVNIDIETGDILFKKGVAELLLENGLKSILYGGPLIDPIHLNDVQPVLEDGTFWKKGDVFLSIRNRSLVLLYRPSTNEIIKLIQGPFVNQHDVDIVEDGVISIFNNNYISNESVEGEVRFAEPDTLHNSEVVLYNFFQNSFSIYSEKVFKLHKIRTASQGLSEFISNGDLFVEEQNNGVVYVIREDELIFKQIFLVDEGKYIMHPTWIQLYETLPY